MGAAELWQTEVVSRLMGNDVLILNPRRDDWRSEWAPVKDNPDFRAQVEWELEGIEACDVLAMYFAPGTKAPITLMEFGLIAQRMPQKMVVCCPDGFYRKGNVDIACERYGIEQVKDLNALVERVLEKLKK